VTLAAVRPGARDNGPLPLIRGITMGRGGKRKREGGKHGACVQIEKVKEAQQ